MIIALCALVCLVVFLGIAFVAVYVQIIRPMQQELRQTRAKQAEQEDMIARNAGATAGLYFANRREINELTRSLYSQGQKIAFVESYAFPVLPEVDEAPNTQRDKDECPKTIRSNRGTV